MKPRPAGPKGTPQVSHLSSQHPRVGSTTLITSFETFLFIDTYMISWVYPSSTSFKGVYGCGSMAGGVLRSKGWDQRNFASQRLLLMRQTVQKKDQHGLGSLLGRSWHACILREMIDSEETKHSVKSCIFCVIVQCVSVVFEDCTWLERIQIKCTHLVISS